MLICNVWVNFAAMKGLTVASNYAGFLGFLAFVTATAHGCLHGRPAVSALAAAIGSMAALAAVGWLLGCIAEQTVDQEVRWRLSQETAAEDGNATIGRDVGRLS